MGLIGDFPSNLYCYFLSARPTFRGHQKMTGAGFRPAPVVEKYQPAYFTVRLAVVLFVSVTGLP